MFQHNLIYICNIRNNKTHALFIICIIDEDVYNNLTENDVINILNDVTDEPFLSIKDELQRFLENTV